LCTISGSIEKFISLAKFSTIWQYKTQKEIGKIGEDLTSIRHNPDHMINEFHKPLEAFIKKIRATKKFSHIKRGKYHIIKREHNIGNK
jgi:hypothetical protein